MRRMLCLAVVSLCCAWAQDQRNVTEPVIPGACVTLSAELTSQHGKLQQEDERKLDTARIQKALDSCPAGHSVELKADASRNAFLSGPIDLRAGVTLEVDEGVTLFASRDPRVFDMAPGTRLASAARSRAVEPAPAGRCSMAIRCPALA